MKAIAELELEMDEAIRAREAALDARLRAAPRGGEAATWQREVTRCSLAAEQAKAALSSAEARAERNKEIER